MDDELQAKIKTLNELIWERRLVWSDVERWLAQYASEPAAGHSEQLHALFLLSNFIYFNSALMRALLHALYRDFVQYPITAKLRRARGNTLDWNLLEPYFQRALKKIRFIGMGNPSESGTHLLYYFRQENHLPTELFIHPHELFDGNSASPRLIEGINHLFFLDDFCGSGTQAKRYSRQLLARIRELDRRIKLSYHPLFATTSGLNYVRESTLFTEVEALCELDGSFRVFEPYSRYFRENHLPISREFAAEMCKRYGSLIEPGSPLGFRGCQLLIGFAHNIPNNTLPIFWSEGSSNRTWLPLFPRYRKGLGW